MGSPPYSIIILTHLIHTKQLLLYNESFLYYQKEIIIVLNNLYQYNIGIILFTLIILYRCELKPESHDTVM